MSDKTVTVIVLDHVKPNCLQEYRQWMSAVNQTLRSFTGFISLDVIEPTASATDGHMEFHVIFRFDNYENLQRWQQSDYLSSRLEEAREYLEQEAKVQFVEGMELWYDLPSNRSSLQKPPYFKQVLVTIITVYPLIIGAGWLLGAIFPISQLHPSLAILFNVVIVAALMVKPVMPYATRVLKPWLYGQ